jgi:hypothetical protein
MLKAVLTTEEHGGLSADVQSHYALADDGSYRLEVSPSGGFEFADTRGLKAALQNERAERGKAAAGLKSLTETVGDLDVAAARAALEKVAEMKDWDPEKKLAEAKAQFEGQLTSKFDNERKALTTKHAEEIKARDAAMTAALGQLQSELIASAAVSAISAAGGSVELLLPIVEKTTRMKAGEDGRYHAEVVDQSGTPRLSPKSGSTAPMSVAELVEELRGDEKFARAFDGSGAKGSGSSRSSGAGAGGAPAGSKSVSRKDLDGMGANLEGIAAGKVSVR